jgi:hypothetical protein
MIGTVGPVANRRHAARANLVALGVQLGWVGAAAKVEAVAAILEHLRAEGDGLLLIYDNGADAASLRPYLPLGGGQARRSPMPPR